MEIYFDKAVEKLLNKLKDSKKREDLLDRAEIFKLLDLLQERGNTLGMPYSRNLKGFKYLKELRVLNSTKNYRIFYFIKDNTIAIMIHPVEKKKQKLNSNILKMIYSKLKEYLRG